MTVGRNEENSEQSENVQVAFHDTSNTKERIALIVLYMQTSSYAYSNFQCEQSPSDMLDVMGHPLSMYMLLITVMACMYTAAFICGKAAVIGMTSKHSC
eukprot:18855-Heterococcus_DN1.PRE.2